MNTRAMTSYQPIELGSKSLTQKSCISDSIRLWNLAPKELKDITNINAMKKVTKIYVNSFPI